jgi:DHA2 family multidrug resistance protein
MATRENSSVDVRQAVNPWVIAMTVTLATFMEVLDSSIANIALPHISGSLGASTDEGTWVLTSYLVSSAIMLPLSGWLTTVMGRKRFYMTCVAIFTVSSVLCGLSTSLPMLIICRILQGAGGGGLQPSEQAILADTFPAEQFSMGFAIYGMAVIVAPALGPTLGGWITDTFSWHWIFFINLPIGALSLFLTNRLVHDPQWLKNIDRSRIRPDYVGIGLIVTGIGFLQYVLDKGQQDDWFASHVITVFFIIAAIILVFLVIREWTHDDPIIDLGLLKNRNFATSISFSFVLGIVLNGSTVLLPLFMQNNLGYTAEQAGMALMPGGLVLMFVMPVAAWAAGRFDRRWVIAFGFLLTALGLHHLTTIYLGVSFHHMMWLRVLQLLGLPFIFVNISTLNYVGVPAEKHNQVSGMANFARNLGGSLGISLLDTFVARQQQMQQVNMTAHTFHASPFFERQLSALTSQFTSMGFNHTISQHKALARLLGIIGQQAIVRSYLNAFWALAFVVGCLTPLVLLLRKPSAADEAAAAGAH